MAAKKDCGITQFDETNYDNWRFRVMSLLGSKEVSTVITEETPKEKQDDMPEVKLMKSK